MEEASAFGRGLSSLMWKNGGTNALQVEHSIGRAADFYAGMELIKGDDLYIYSASLLAIHSAISYSGGLRLSFGSEELAAENHQEAVRRLDALLHERRCQDKAGLAHLRFLVSVKRDIAYGDRKLDSGLSSLILTKAERFSTWASMTGKQLLLRGWTNVSR